MISKIVAKNVLFFVACFPFQIDGMVNQVFPTILTSLILKST